ncbi:MAG: hypothetical protein IH971_07705 [Candidatus Marinimicrobia bacterium]|nr:hypothetical protein [Candidatus Neomarinimicrobiota bacterium]
MDFHIRVDALLDYVGELLVILDKSFNARHPSGVSSPELPAKFRKTPKAPTIEFDKREWDKLRGDIPSRLYESSIVQLASHFEIFISELVSEVYFANTSLLAIDELQLTTRQILEIGSIEKIRQYLIEKATRNLISRSYPALVEAFQHTFHVGLHQSHAPLPQVEIHHFIEIRNLIVHNDGHV